MMQRWGWCEQAVSFTALSTRNSNRKNPASIWTWLNIHCVSKKRPNLSFVIFASCRLIFSILSLAHCGHTADVFYVLSMYFVQLLSHLDSAVSRVWCIDAVWLQVWVNA